MRCRRIHHWMNEYIEERLPVKEKRAVESHLATCAACRQLATDMQEILTNLRTLPHATTSDSFWARLQQRLPEHQTFGLTERIRERFRAWVGAPVNQWATVSAAVAIVVVLTVALLRQNQETVNPERSLAHSYFVMQCVEQHAAYAGEETMPNVVPLAQRGEAPLHMQGNH